MAHFCVYRRQPQPKIARKHHDALALHVRSRAAFADAGSMPASCEICGSVGCMHTVSMMKRNRGVREGRKSNREKKRCVCVWPRRQRALVVMNARASSFIPLKLAALTPPHASERDGTDISQPNCRPPTATRSTAGAAQSKPLPQVLHGPSSSISQTTICGQTTICSTHAPSNPIILKEAELGHQWLP